MSKANFKQLIIWVENTIRIYEEILNDKKQPPSRRDATFYNYNLKNLALIKEYLIDYQKLSDDYRALDKKYNLLRLQKMELDSRLIFEDMKKEYRANRRKWKAKQD